MSQAWVQFQRMHCGVSAYVFNLEALMHLHSETGYIDEMVLHSLFVLLTLDLILNT